MGCDTEPVGSCEREEPPEGEIGYRIVIQDVKRTKKILILSEVDLVYSMNFN